MATSPFAAAKTPRLPGLACKGIISEVPEAKLTDSQDYYMIRVKFQGIEGSKDVVVNHLYRPEWYAPNFDPTTLEVMANSPDEEIARRGRAFEAVYRNNIGGTNSQISNLKGFCGANDESLNKFAELRDALYTKRQAEGEKLRAALYAKKNEGKADPEDLTEEEIFEGGATGGFSGDDIQGLLSKFLMQVQGGKVIGYVLKQAKQKTDETDENNKAIYELRSNYEVQNYYVPSAKAHEAFVKKAKSAVPAGSFKIAYQA